jgi:hypothetical protein
MANQTSRVEEHADNERPLYEVAYKTKSVSKFQKRLGFDKRYNYILCKSSTSYLVCHSAYIYTYRDNALRSDGSIQPR